MHRQIKAQLILQQLMFKMRQYRALKQMQIKEKDQMQLLLQAFTHQKNLVKYQRTLMEQVQQMQISI